LLSSSNLTSERPSGSARWLSPSCLGDICQCRILRCCTAPASVGIPAGPSIGTRVVVFVDDTGL
jgi:hypothetical protein